MAAGGDDLRGAKGVAAVLTSCGRQDLLEKTLDSFFACNTYPLAQTIIVEDGPQEANSRLQKKYMDRDITWLSTGKRVGQIAAIDYVYSFIEQPYIFHLEDDWQFYQAGFIEKSLAILEALPDCLQVWIRALHDTNRTPISAAPETIDRVAFLRVESGYLGKWHGFSFNPGLRRTRRVLRPPRKIRLACAARPGRSGHLRVADFCPVPKAGPLRRDPVGQCRQRLCQTSRLRPQSDRSHHPPLVKAARCTRRGYCATQPPSIDRPRR